MIHDSLNCISYVKSKQSNVQPSVKSDLAHFKWKPLRSKHAGMVQFIKLHTAIWSKPYANLLHKQEQKANIWTRTGTQVSCKNNQWTCPFSNSVLICLCLTRHSDPGHVRIYRCGFEWSFLKRCWQHWQRVEAKVSGFGCMKAFSTVLLYFFYHICVV